MKDLYRKLDIDPKASAEELAAALQNRPDLSEYTAVLLDEKKRAGYDRTHATLKTIGVLRHKLALDSGDSWFLEHYPDFAPKNILEKRPANFGTSAPATSSDKHGQEFLQRGSEPERGSGSKPPVIVLVGIVIAFLAILVYVFL